MKAEALRKKLDLVQEALKAAPGEWEILNVIAVRTGDDRPTQLRIIANGPKSERELKELLGPEWQWNTETFREAGCGTLTKWTAAHGNGTELAGDFYTPD